MKKQTKRETAAHPAHPIRNFFYVLWSLLNAAAFTLGFFFLATEPFSYRIPLIVLCGGIVFVALVVGIVRPLIRGR